MSRCCCCTRAPRKPHQRNSSVWYEFDGEVVFKISELENRGKSISKFPAFLKKMCRLCVQRACGFRGEKCCFSGISVPPFNGWKLEFFPAPVSECVLCLSEHGMPEPHFLLLPSESVHCLLSLLCSRSQWLLGICFLNETDQSNTAQTSGGHSSSRRGKEPRPWEGRPPKPLPF